MAEEDIYGNKARYERFIGCIEKVLEKPGKTDRKKYYCKNKANLKYYKKIIRKLEVGDQSYILRNKLMSHMHFLTFHIECDLKDVDKYNKDDKLKGGLIIKIRETYSYTVLKEVEGTIKRIGRMLFEDTEVPEFYNKFKINTDISRQKTRKDKLTYEEFEKIMKFFSSDIVMQAYLSLAMETLARPQEICYLKNSDVGLFDNYAVLQVSEHGKEGTKKLLSVDSFPYLLRMIKNHRNSENKEYYLFLNHYGNQLTPYLINKRLKLACKTLEMDKPITCYSLKRFGVTYRRLNGDSDVDIQRIAGWRSTKQLQIYDQSDQDDVFKRELIKKGIMVDESIKSHKTKICPYCSKSVGFAEDICPECLHILNRDLVKERIEEDKKLIEFINGIKDIKETNPEIFEVLRVIGKKKGII